MWEFSLTSCWRSVFAKHYPNSKLKFQNLAGVFPVLNTLSHSRGRDDSDFKMFEASCLAFSTSPETLEPMEEEDATKYARIPASVTSMAAKRRRNSSEV
jgi:hypothetical protein